MNNNVAIVNFIQPMAGQARPMTSQRFGNPKGDRVALGMTGKFLPFKYYGAKGNEIAYGLKEE